MITNTTQGQKSLALLLDQIEDRASKATPGPFTVGERAMCERDILDEADQHYPIFWPDCGNGAHVFKKEDAEFIAASRTDVPLLVKALRRAMEAFGEPEASLDNVDAPRQNELLPCPFCRCTMESRGDFDHPRESGVWTSHPRAKCILAGMWFRPAQWNERAGQSVSDGGGSGASRVSSPKVLSEITAILEGKEQKQKDLG